jgi:RNA polymerase sigma-70 factor (ECF subfamily)
LTGSRYHRVVEPHKAEVELARRLMDGDQSAFEPFVEAIGSKVMQYTVLMCGQREDAEEVVQDTLLKIFGSFDQLREPERVKPWVFRIAKNFCLMKRRKSVFAPEREISLDELMPERGGESAGRKIEIADWSALPEDKVLEAELKGRIGAALAELPHTYRSVVVLRDVEGLSTAETAEVLDLSEDAVKQRLHRGRLSLRKTLDGYLAEMTPGETA